MPTSESEPLTDTASDCRFCMCSGSQSHDVSKLNYGRFKIQPKPVSEPSEFSYKTQLTFLPNICVLCIFMAIK